jgi:putative heme-binding domain-containing protein
MKRFSRYIGCTLLIGLATSAASECRADNQFVLAEDSVVTFLGGTNMVRLQQAGYLEAMIARNYAQARPKFRDLAWEADTVFRQGTVIERWRNKGHHEQAFGDLSAQLKRVGTTVVVAQFGRLESLAGKDGLDSFTRSYEQLIDALQKQAQLVVLVTPTPFERPSSPRAPDLSKRNADLALYVKAIAKLTGDRELIYVDLFTDAKPGLTDNGMHIRPEAQAHVALQIAQQLSIEGANKPGLEPLRQAVIEKHRLWYDYWRPANWKLLYGDDDRRQFTRGQVPFREEWKKLIPMVAKAEERVWQIAGGGKDPGPNRPKPEVLHGDPSADVEKELADFTVPEGLQVNLFASEREGLTSPLAIRWDPAGRAFVSVTTTYPHVFPGDVPNDKIIVLEDTDWDGTADKSTVYAEGLNIPTAMELGDGGVYVGQNTEVLFLKDTDGDGKADQRRVLLSGFGNGDSHQTINSFVWSPDGELYFGHGDGCESRVETPWGASNLFNAGFYRLRPRRSQLLPFLEGHMGPGNPWGVAFDNWGQIFSVDGAGGVTYLTPGQVSTTHRVRFNRIGDPGGYCGIGYLDGRHVPESMHGDFVVGDFKANRIKRFSVRHEGAGFSLQWKDPVLHSRHRNFRPVDVKVGPDGAIYVVDWYNPITCHQDDAYRDPKRDKAHGRIWRISSKKPTVKPPNLAEASINELLDALTAPERWTRYQAKRALTEHDTVAVAKALNAWVRALDPKLPNYEHHLYEALGTYATIEVVRPGLLGRLLQAKDYRARAFATRVTGRWHDRLNDPLTLLARRIADEHPQVRLEAVLACSLIPSAKSIAIAAAVVDRPMDYWTSYTFKQSVHALRPHWLPAFTRGEVSFAKPNHLAAVLNETGGREALDSLKRLVESEELDGSLKQSAIAAILAVGGPEDLQTYGLDTKHFTQTGQHNAGLHAGALTELIKVARFRDARPAGDVAASLNHLIGSDHPQLKAKALTLAGIWKVEKTQPSVLSAAKNSTLAVPVRAAAFQAAATMQLPDARELLDNYAASAGPPALRSAAIQALANLDAISAAKHAATLFDAADLEALDARATLTAFLNRSGGAEALAAAIQAQKLKPAAAKPILRSLFSTGRSDRVLLSALNHSIGAATNLPDYSDAYVSQLVADARQHGAAMRGKILFNSLACVSCHKVGGSGGDVGPDLTAIGTTLSAERITEELLWPNRQVKEGFTVVQVITNDGKVLQGFERKTKESQASGDVVIQDLTTKELVTIKKQDIDETHSIGSAMPVGLTAVLSREQLLDLLRYLSELGEIK